MKRLSKKQQGMTMISTLCVVMVVVSMFLLALKILPIYIDNGKVTGALDSIKNNPEAKNEGPEQLSKRLFKILQINSSDNLITKENVSITTQDDGSTRIQVKYSVTKPLVKNASILVEFDDFVDLK